MQFLHKNFFIIFIFLTIEAFALTKTQNILLVHSYHRGYKWSDDISKVMEDKFEHRDDVSLTTVYMDTKKIATPLYFDRLFKLYEEQFKNRGFDLIIAADNNALEFVIRYHEHLFKDLPVVFLGINNFDEAMIYENNMRQYTTGVVEKVDIQKNIDLMLKLQPKLEKIYIINDRSKTGYAVKRDIFKVLPLYKKRIKFEYIDNIAIENLKNKISHLPKNSAILWVLLFKDKAGKSFTYKESLRQVRDISNVPIYGLWDFYLGKGIVGGVLTSAKAQALAASVKVEKILKGANPEYIPIQLNSPNKYLFDYNELREYDIKVPQNIGPYNVINKPFSFYETYKSLVWITLSIMVMFMIILTILAKNIAKRKKSEVALTNQLKFLEVLMDAIPNPINYKNLNGEYIGCNKAFAEFFSKTKEQIIGKNVYDFFQEDLAKEHTKHDINLLKEKGSDTFEKTLHLQDGKSRIVTYSKTVYEDINGSLGGIVSVMDDITDRVQQKQFLIQQSKLAEMGEMVAAIAHQWNEPLVELSAILQDMEFSYKLNEMNEMKMRDFVNESMVQIQYMSQTLKDFRNFLKPSTTKVLFCAKQALNEVLEIIGRQVFYAHIKITITCSEDKIPVYGFENEFKQVLLNMINNSKNKLVAKKSGTNIFIDLSTSNEISTIHVKDDGDKIPNGVIKFIFDPYFTTNKEGTGLGLYMAKVIIEDKMNGKLEVTNENNSPVFSIYVPNCDRSKKNENIIARR